MALASTHGMTIASAGQTAAGTVTLGTITLPAGGPWTIHDVWVQVVSATLTVTDCVEGFLSVNADSGDVTPNVLPNAFPVQESGSGLGATGGVTVCPLHRYPVNWQAAGKAVLTFTFTTRTALVVAPQLVCGIMFGPAAPEKKPIVHISQVAIAQTAAADTLIGTITLPETVKKVTGVMGMIGADGVLVAAEEYIGIWRITSDDLDILPMSLPFSNAYGGALGALALGSTNLRNEFIPVDIDVPGGTRLQCFVDLNTAVTNPAQISVYVAHE